MNIEQSDSFGDRLASVIAVWMMVKSYAVFKYSAWPPPLIAMTEADRF